MRPRLRRPRRLRHQGIAAGVRPLLERLEPGDILVYMKLDRNGRSVRNLVDVMADLGQRGIDLVVPDRPSIRPRPAAGWYSTSWPPSPSSSASRSSRAPRTAWPPLQPAAGTAAASTG
jgi:hypothetical protein